MKLILLISKFLLVSVICSTTYGNENVSIVADSVSYSEDGNILVANGDVQVKYGQYTLTTPTLKYFRNTNTIFASNPIKLKTENNLKILAESAQISDDLRIIIANYSRALIDNQFHVTSDKLEKLKNGKSAFYDSIGSACQVCPLSPVPMWQIRSEKISHDPENRILEFKNAWMEVAGIPIIFTPYLRVPEPGVRRATGLLTPKILTSDLLGVGLKQPFYINLSKSSDLTSAVLKTTKTNILFETEYRQIFNNGNLKISSAALPNNRKNLLDGYFKIDGKQKYRDNIILKYDVTAVSDSGFLGRYGYSDTDRLKSFISTESQTKKSFIEINSTYFTSLRDIGEKEHVVAPNFYTRKFYSNIKNKFSSGIELSIVGLTRDRKDNNFRINSSIDAKKFWHTNSGVQFKGVGKFSSSFYRIQKPENEIDFLEYYNPTLVFELNLPLYKKKNNRVDLIEPVLQLIYNPDFSATNIVPNEDSQQIKLDQTSLFSTNRFSGLDRQEYGLRLNSGLNYSVENNGPFSYDLAIGQVFREVDSMQFSEGSGLSGLKSNILIAASVDYKNSININAQQLFDQDFSLKQAESAFTYIEENKSFSSGLVYSSADPNEGRLSDLTELTIGLNSSLDTNWDTQLNIRRNLKENENINAIFGIAYENECSKINLTFNRRFSATATLPEDTKIEITFDFNGLGNKRRSVNKSSCSLYKNGFF